MKEHDYHLQIDKVLWQKFLRTIDHTSNPKKILTEFVEKRIKEFEEKK